MPHTIADIKLAEADLRDAVKQLTAARLRVTLAQLRLADMKRTPRESS